MCDKKNVFRTPPAQFACRDKSILMSGLPRGAGPCETVPYIGSDNPETSTARKREYLDTPKSVEKHRSQHPYKLGAPPVQEPTPYKQTHTPLRAKIMFIGLPQPPTNPQVPLHLHSSSHAGGVREGALRPAPHTGRACLATLMMRKASSGRHALFGLFLLEPVHACFPEVDIKIFVRGYIHFIISSPTCSPPCWRGGKIHAGPVAGALGRG